MRDDLAKKKPAARINYNSLGIFDFIAKVSPHLERPLWFAPYVRWLETAVGGGHELVFAAPPQHGKTVVTTHALVWALARYPSLQFGYATYNKQRAISVARAVRKIAGRAGLDLTGTLDHCYTKQGGGIIFAGRGTSITGEPINGFGIVDDPFKGRAEAESKVVREAAFDWHGQDWMTRHHPGVSSFIMATRWHEDDLSGRRVKEGWSYLNLPAIAEENDPLGRKPGEALCPSRWPLKALERQRKNLTEYGWWSLFQGHPRPKGGKLFDGVTLAQLAILPATGFRIGIGIDLAYSKKTHADYSVAVVLLEIDGIKYVVDVIREQVKAPEFASKLKRLLDRYPGCRPRWYCAGPEVGVADMMSNTIGRIIEAISTTADKFSRAQSTAAAWNAGEIRVIQGADWADVFVGEVCDFTGINDINDDMVDALVAAYDSFGNMLSDDDAKLVVS